MQLVSDLDRSRLHGVDSGERGRGSGNEGYRQFSRSCAIKGVWGIKDGKTLQHICRLQGRTSPEEEMFGVPPLRTYYASGAV